jgi:hypothetical protein
MLSFLVTKRAIQRKAAPGWRKGAGENALLRDRAARRAVLPQQRPAGNAEMEAVVQQVGCRALLRRGARAAAAAAAAARTPSAARPAQAAAQRAPRPRPTAAPRLVPRADDGAGVQRGGRRPRPLPRPRRRRVCQRRRLRRHVGARPHRGERRVRVPRRRRVRWGRGGQRHDGDRGVSIPRAGGGPGWMLGREARQQRAGRVVSCVCGRRRSPPLRTPAIAFPPLTGRPPPPTPAGVPLAGRHLHGGAAVRAAPRPGHARVCGQPRGVRGRVGRRQAPRAGHAVV